MPVIEDFGKENYDKLKIFLISHFNIRFLEDSNPEVEETFEITTPEGVLSGSFLSNDSLGFSFDVSVNHHFEKIMSKIKEIQPDFHVAAKTDRQGLDQFVLNSQSLYNHLTHCSKCKKKFYEIWNHLK